MDIARRLDRRIGIAAGIPLAAIEGKQRSGDLTILSGRPVD
jgi:hypothetical protein